MLNASEFDFFEDRYPKRARKPINKPDLIDDLEDEVLFQKQKLMSHCVYDIHEIVSSSEFNDDAVVKISNISDFNFEQFKMSGLLTPILFTVPPEQLGMIIPEPKTFTVFDVLELVGKERKIEVVEVNEQKGRTMKLSDFIKYYTCPPEFRTELLNVLSLEFSLTNLAKMVKAPAFVSEIDWIDNFWPKELLERQIIYMKTNLYSDFSTYPKVQRYCLMSVANCFTDFHIDFGGTSVWYHVLKGKKIFWLIEPTEENLLLYEEWIMRGNNSESFFGRIVNKCSRVELKPGMTFIIPAGWIHCVFTPEDSLVFGGNFLHSFGIPMQIRVVKSEDKIKVGRKYRFPHFKQMIWYVIENIVRKSTGRIYLKPIKAEAYLSNLQNYDKKKIMVEENEEVESTDDQEPCCSSAVETGCKKSGLIKETFFSEMGLEKSDSDNDEEQQEIKLEDENICYDDLPNGADGSYMLVPTQITFGAKNTEKFVPVESYNEDFLKTILPVEINGYQSLLEYAKKLLKTKKPDVGEGITRPKHLLLEFEHLVKHLSKDKCFEVEKNFFLYGKGANVSNYQQFCSMTVTIKHFEATSKTFKTFSKKRKKKQSRRLDQTSPILVDGLPHPLHSLKLNKTLPNMYGFNPLETIVPLGQKPLPSAYRQSSNMAQAPPVHRFKLKKKENLSLTDTTERKDIHEKVETNENSDSNLNFSNFKNSQKSSNDTSEKTTSKLSIYRLSKHSTDPELAYKSPLQRIQHQKQSTSLITDPKDNVFEDPNHSKTVLQNSLQSKKNKNNINYSFNSKNFINYEKNISQKDFGIEHFNNNISNQSIENQDSEPSVSVENKKCDSKIIDGVPQNKNDLEEVANYQTDCFNNCYDDTNSHTNRKKRRSENSRPDYGYNSDCNRNDWKGKNSFNKGNYQGYKSNFNSKNYSNKFDDNRHFSFNNNVYSKDKRENYNDSNRGKFQHNHQYQNNRSNNYSNNNVSNTNQNVAPPNMSSYLPRMPLYSNNTMAYHHFQPPIQPTFFFQSNFITDMQMQHMSSRSLDNKEKLSTSSNQNELELVNETLDPNYKNETPQNFFNPCLKQETTSKDTNKSNDPELKASVFEIMDIELPKEEVLLNKDKIFASSNQTSSNNCGLWNKNLESQELQQKQSTSTSAESSLHTTTLDGFEAINEIGRLTKIMGGENKEDIDLRDPAYYLTKKSEDTLASDYKTEGGNISPNPTNDPTTAIDQIYRLSQLFH